MNRVRDERIEIQAVGATFVILYLPFEASGNYLKLGSHRTCQQSLGLSYRAALYNDAVTNTCLNAKGGYIVEQLSIENSKGASVVHRQKDGSSEF